MRKNFLKTLIIISLSSCTMAPNYKRPEANIPLQEASEAESITKITWQEFFESSDLKKLIDLALKNNYDLKIANLNVESVRAQHDITRGDLLPSIGAIASETKQGVPGAFSSFMPKKQFRANITLAAYELDFFGKLRSLKKAALEKFLASKEARNVTKISLISEITNSYAQLLCDQEILEIAEENLRIQQERNRLVEIRYKNGLDPYESFIDSTITLANAKNNKANYQKIVEQDKNALMTLAGSFDAEILPKNQKIDDVKINEKLLDFIPSKSLLSRPDIQEAEHNLKSANANIGAARAAFFPSITLTGSYGYGSRSLSSLFSSRFWTFTPQINLPIFNGGKTLANLELANLEKKTEILNYEKAIQNAFREALDQLAQRKSISKQLESFEEILNLRNKSYDLTKRKHKNGLNSGLELYDARTALLLAKQERVSAKKEYIANLIELYKALGGGSEATDKKE